ncbi:hypothetical protein INT46_007949 [Mucor plumbeus]|uniref:Uncharacterized protein n=1 Tax=Mucor plumbeus TaxID=97098 RepID=A0A8H7QKX1_9FUNG|nr:hypothetical protein INT46_007949 [Mucor plumbeus]
MTRTLPYDMQGSIKSLLLRNSLICSIKKMYLTVGMANLSKYRREFLEGAQASTGGRSIFDWRKWVFSGKTKVNIGGSVSKFFYWSDVPGTNRPHQIRPQAQGNGDGIMLWGRILGYGPGYNTAIIHGTIDSNNQNEFFVDKILDWPPQNSDLNRIEHIRGDLKRHRDAYPNKPATK